MTLKARGLVVEYSLRERGCVRALGHVDLDLAPRVSTALLGPNGSGKSTLLLTLAGLVDLNSGCVSFRGRQLTDIAPRDRATHFNCLLQGETVAFDFTVFELVRLGGHHKVAASELNAAVERALSRLHISRLADRRWSTLSGGQQQRVQLARTLVTEADILLLDEPFNHLDLFTRALLLDLLEEERDRGASVVFSAHDLEAASRADRVLVLDKGRKIALGPPSKVLTRELVAEIFHVQVEPIASPQTGPPFFRLVSPLPQQTP